MSLLPFPSRESDEELIARNYVDNASGRYGGAFVFVNYKDKIYPGLAKFLEVKNRPDLHIVRVQRLNPAATSGMVDIVMRRRPGVVKFNCHVEHERIFYASIKEDALVPLNVDEERLARLADYI